MEIAIEGVITTPEGWSEDKFFTEFIKAIKSIGCSYGGSIVELDKDGNPIGHDNIEANQ